MICPKCSTAADLMEAATAVFTRRDPDPFYPDAPLDAIREDEALAAMATASAVVRLHSECTGGAQGCGCRHRAGRP